MGNCCQDSHRPRASSIAYPPRLEICIKSSRRNSFRSPLLGRHISTIVEDSDEDQEATPHLSVFPGWSSSSTYNTRSKSNATFKLQNCNTLDYLTLWGSPTWQLHSLPGGAKLYNPQLNSYYLDVCLSEDDLAEGAVLKLLPDDEDDWQIVEMQ